MIWKNEIVPYTPPLQSTLHITTDATHLFLLLGTSYNTNEIESNVT